MKTSLKQIDATFEKYSELHKQIASYSNKPNLNMNDDIQYPLMHVNYDKTTINTQETIHECTILVLDRINDSESNLIDVLSNTEQIQVDFYVFFRHNESNFGFEIRDDNVTCTAVKVNYDGNVAGQSVKCVITRRVQNNIHQIPIETWQ